jgi:hypothetical protein
MAQISLNQAKELVEKWDMLDISLRDLSTKLNRTVKHLDQKLSEDGDIIVHTTKTDKKLFALRCVVAVNFGVILGLFLAKMLFG